MIWDAYEKQNEMIGMVKGKKTLRTTADIVQLDNVLQKDSVREKAEETSADASVDSQEPQYVNDLSQDSGQKIQTDRSYEGKQSVTETEEFSSSSAIGYVWTMTLSELNTISFGKKGMTTTNDKIKSMYGDAHKVAMNNALKPDDIDIRLFLSVPIAQLPENIISCVKSMEKAIDNNSIMKIEGAQLNSVEELALHHIILSIYLNHSVNSSEWQSGEIDFVARSNVQHVDQSVIAENTSPSPTSSVEIVSLVRNASSSPAPSVETESLLENIWSIWNDVLYDMLTDDHDDKDIHECSLEYLGIIILAVSLDECHTLLLKNSLKVKKAADPGLQFTFDLFIIFATQILNKRDVLSKQESIYNYRAIFRFFDAVVSATLSCTFFPGETRLQAINKELERLKISAKSYYNADGVILDNNTGSGLCLLETSDPFGLIDISRETTDQVKASYGLLSMIRTIAHQFVYCDIKMLFDGATSFFNEIKASHNKNETAYCDGHIDNLPRLDYYLVESAEVKLSSRISQVSEIYVSSSPIRPDSQ
ncbi:hypothetical protein G6F47_008134 [Rhizopus delemar]|nr:hypothetical protein G6F54_006352 [Rhizopus delemar]KAG1507893.1 hypothetical protein G6F53_008602 [Rhizopus delemar]KAG1596521.1 hypothetical protein G6F47_008134 [Rhizopus delemar]